jgi:hypothetical protein
MECERGLRDWPRSPSGELAVSVAELEWKMKATTRTQWQKSACQKNSVMWDPPSSVYDGAPVEKAGQWAHGVGAKSFLGTWVKGNVSAEANYAHGAGLSFSLFSFLLFSILVFKISNSYFKLKLDSGFKFKHQSRCTTWNSSMKCKGFIGFILILV